MKKITFVYFFTRKIGNPLHFNTLTGTYKLPENVINKGIKMKRLLFALSILSVGCYSAATLRDTYRSDTVGHVGCAFAEIEVKDIDQGNNSWTAVCRGAVYFCSKKTPSTAEIMLTDAPVGASQYPTYCARSEKN